MPNSEIARTESAHNRLLGGLLAAIIASVLLTLIVFVWVWKESHTRLAVHGSVYYLQIVRTTAAQDKGLGGRTSLPQNEGMLFAFSNPQTLCFWMKDMHFPLDMVWLNGDKQVVSIANNVPVNSYPRAYCPHTPAQYVIELNAGQAASADLYRGETLTL